MIFKDHIHRSCKCKMYFVTKWINCKRTFMMYNLSSIIIIRVKAESLPENFCFLWFISMNHYLLFFYNVNKFFPILCKLIPISFRLYIFFISWTTFKLLTLCMCMPIFLKYFIFMWIINIKNIEILQRLKCFQTWRQVFSVSEWNVCKIIWYYNR